MQKRPLFGPGWKHWTAGVWHHVDPHRLAGRSMDGCGRMAAGGVVGSGRRVRRHAKADPTIFTAGTSGTFVWARAESGHSWGPPPVSWWRVISLQHAAGSPSWHVLVSVRQSGGLLCKLRGKPIPTSHPQYYKTMVIWLRRLIDIGTRCRCDHCENQKFVPWKP